MSVESNSRLLSLVLFPLLNSWLAGKTLAPFSTNEMQNCVNEWWIACAPATWRRCPVCCRRDWREKLVSFWTFNWKPLASETLFSLRWSKSIPYQEWNRLDPVIEFRHCNGSLFVFNWIVFILFVLAIFLFWRLSALLEVISLFRNLVSQFEGSTSLHCHVWFQWKWQTSKW